MLFIALFIGSITFFSTIAIAQNIRDAREERNSNNEVMANQSLQSDAQAM